jgi:transglutaminase-like putative cysteine protease
MAHAIYEWIVENTYRKPSTRGCGVGNIRFMLESGDLGGKCADLNALYVGLARAAGLPARDVYGIRLAKSEMGYKSLGTSSDNVTKSQHCRAQVHLSAYGWAAVDPADVRKIMLE